MSQRGRNIVLFTLITILVISVSLFVAAHLVFPPGSSLTCKATFAISESQRVTQTFIHNYPGLLSMAPISGGFLYAAFIGAIIGLPSGILLSLLVKNRFQKTLTMLGLSIGCFLEYNLESLLVLILNSHHSEQAGPFMSYEVPLVGFSIEAFFPLSLLLNLETSFLVHLLKPMGVVGIYFLYVFPVAFGLLGFLLAKKLDRSRE